MTHVRVISERIPGRYMIVTVNGFVVGRRLDRGVGNYPECKTRGLTLDEAQSSCAVWEKFCEMNKKRK